MVKTNKNKVFKENTVAHATKLCKARLSLKKNNKILTVLVQSFFVDCIFPICVFIDNYGSSSRKQMYYSLLLHSSEKILVKS